RNRIPYIFGIFKKLFIISKDDYRFCGQNCGNSSLFSLFLPAENDILIKCDERKFKKEAFVCQIQKIIPAKRREFLQD
ncbi:MAG: hypothetical protein KHY93_07085, partial [Clostridiales bacterium]|nr:hypothetical protein [Clostridiales bacterium]